MPTTIDVKGLNCPLPVLRVKKHIRQVGIGETLRVLATDPGAPRDIKAFCDAGGHAYLGDGEKDGVFEIEIRRQG